ncbi:MAG: MarC family protein, partial [Mycobacteriales bacterium]
MPSPFGTALVTVLVLLEPIGNVPMFLSLTRRQDRRARNRTALLAVVVAFLILGTFALIGETLLAYLKITIQDLQVAGGILLMVVALQMISGAAESAASEEGNVAIVPLATPLLAGPGAMVALLVLLDEYKATPDRIAIMAAVGLALGVIFLAFRFASVIAARLHPALARAVTRLVGLLVAAIAVHFIASAIGTWFHNGV